MDPVDVIRERALILLNTNDSASLSEAASLFKTVEDIEQQRANGAKLRVERDKLEHDLKYSRHHTKENIGAITPLVTTIVLAGTLYFQVRQAQQLDRERHEESAQQRQAAEQLRFTEGLKLIQTSERFTPTAALLSSFSVEPQKTEARQMGVKLLIRSQSADEYKDLFSSIFEPVNPTDVPALLQLNRSAYAEYNELGAKTWNSEKKESDPSKLSASDRARNDVLIVELGFLSSKLAPALQRPRPLASTLDLTSISISDVSLEKADLHNADLTLSGFTNVNLEGADLSNISQYEGVRFLNTAWWHAARINPSLLEYLKKEAPYDEKQTYRTAIKESADVYKNKVERLRSLATK